MKLWQKIRHALIVVSFLLFPITLYYFSPYLIVESSAKGIVSGSFVVFSLMLVFSIFLGRLFCGWLCPAGGLQEICFNANDKKISQKYNWIKFLIWTPWVILIAYTALKAGGYKSIDFFYQTNNGISVAEPTAYFVFYSVTGLILMMSLIVGRRSFCHHVCWMAPFMIIGNKIGKTLKIPTLALESKKEKCINCMACTKNCPMSLDVNSMVQKQEMKNPECILCGTCADNCTKKVISYNIK